MKVLVKKESYTENIIEALTFIVSITLIFLVFAYFTKPSSSFSSLEMFLYFYGLAIMIIMPLGYQSLLKAYKLIHENQNLLNKIELNGNDILEKYTIDNINYNIEDVDSILLENIEYSFPMPAPIKLVQRIMTRAKDWRFDSTSEIISPYIEEMEKEAYKFETLQKLAIRLGILGTFFGLSLAINQNAEILSKLSTNINAGNLNIEAIEGMIRTSISKESALLEKLFIALQISFSTSIAGLLAAVMLSGMLYRLKKRMFPMFHIYQDAAVTATNVAMRAIKNKSFLEEFGYIKDLIKKKEEITEKKLDETTSEIKEVNKKITEQEDKIGKGIEKLGVTKDNLEEYLEKTNNIQGKIITNLKILYEYTEFKDVISTVKTSITESSTVVKTKLEEILENFDEFLEEVIEKNEKEMDKINKKVNGISSSLNEDGKIIKARFEAISISAEHIKNILNNIQNTIMLRPRKGQTEIDLHDLNKLVKALVVIGTVAILEGIIFLILVLN